MTTLLLYLGMIGISMTLIIILFFGFLKIKLI
uniref:Cytochrome b6-f complex subunit 6 n=1 Tax=Rhipiliopsis peltata TaxID=2320810 RepID=A0A386B1G3_9CHLO|nr:cytochrome b6-f complex subunit 6 [Rhipiliopsis peltata]AYC65535.1 cytochrome b6-f complex subunit 6 [Rhipiliopsis peltata]